MNTPTHLILGAAAFAKPGAPWITVAALAGAMVPDLSLYLMAGWHLMILGTSPQVVFGQLYYSEGWQSIFAIDNSFVLWGIALLAAFIAKKPVWIAFTGAAFLHLLFDFPLHNHDARQHFWPLTDWVFVSPVSYWDPAHHGTLVARLEIAFALILLVVLWRRFRGVWHRIAIGAAGIAQLAPALLWIWVF